MKKIDFGYNEDRTLNATFSAIEPYNGEYIDTISYEDMDFLVTKIIESYKGLDGGIDVREVTQDYFADGSYVTYANKEKSQVCKKLETLLNSNSIKEKLINGESAFKVLRNEGFPVSVSTLQDITLDSEFVPGIVTSIKPDVFKKLKDSKRTSMSMFNMSEEIKRLYQEIEKLKQENVSNRHM